MQFAYLRSFADLHIVFNPNNFYEPKQPQPNKKAR